MSATKRQHTPALKAQVALASTKGDRTINEIASHFGVHPKLVQGWKKQLLTGIEGVFTPGAKSVSHKNSEGQQAE